MVYNLNSLRETLDNLNKFLKDILPLLFVIYLLEK